MNNQNLSTLTLHDIEKIIINAYHEAELMMGQLNLIELLKKHNLNDMNKLSSFVFEQLSKNSTIDYSVVNNNDDEVDSDDADNNINNNYDTTNYNNNNNKHIVVDHPEIDSEFDEDSSDDDGQNPYHLKVSKQIFQGMRIFDTINPAKAYLLHGTITYIMDPLGSSWILMDPRGSPWILLDPDGSS
ncbi:unnamed protein product [Adineta steineri]|uniref:Uncharacterized protein n=1 Tax=Adineta steineri TaxID=433720 RepID=A0A814YE69_9BILA|nr:unnamed protein product [Adineta steineri]CAF1228019.1 unnamed protein product [Adineta steineri]CAF1509332.1 unnamed protein product [Adineta steineri]CAF4026556.1 unnamed protein product [Adineta steineri]CAF4063144.1 unnamed protein product [Adineta steineri]